MAYQLWKRVGRGARGIREWRPMLGSVDVEFGFRLRGRQGMCEYTHEHTDLRRCFTNKIVLRSHQGQLFAQSSLRLGKTFSIVRKESRAVEDPGMGSRKTSKETMSRPRLDEQDAYSLCTCSLGCLVDPLQLLRREHHPYGTHLMQRELDAGLAIKHLGIHTTTNDEITEPLFQLANLFELQLS